MPFLQPMLIELLHHKQAAKMPHLLANHEILFIFSSCPRLLIKTRSGFFSVSGHYF